MAAAMRWEGAWSMESSAGWPALANTLVVEAAVVMLPGVSLSLSGAATLSATDTLRVGWLPRGRYRVRVILPAGLAAGTCEVSTHLRMGSALTEARWEAGRGDRVVLDSPTQGGGEAAWSIEALAPTVPVDNLSWRRGHADWFFRHFDHAAQVVHAYLLADAQELRGRILDVGCGDGITDFSLALRTGCSELVGIDPFRGYERLPTILQENHVPADAVPPTLRFLPADGNAIPFPDDSFDVVVSWGSVEHIKGGYQQALREMRRVLRPDGLLFIHPGLYYGNFGHHLGEFSSEPHFHLKKTRSEVRDLVLATRPSYIDRSGEFASPEQYWQWFTELNPITVPQFERELRALGFEPWRVALRTQDLIEYTPALQAYPMQDLATLELYLSCRNRKARGERR